MIFSRKLVPVVFGPDYMYRGSNATSPRIPQVPMVSDGRTVRLSVWWINPRQVPVVSDGRTVRLSVCLVK